MAKESTKEHSHENHVDLGQNNIDHYLMQTKVTGMAALVFLFIGLLASGLFFEIDFFKDSYLSDLHDRGFFSYLVYTIQITSFLSCCCLVTYRYYSFLYNKSINNESNMFIFSRNFKILIIELIITLFMPIPYIDFTVQNFNYEEEIITFYTLNQIQCLMMSTRLFIICNIILKNLPHSSVRMNRILKICNIEESLLFIVKCLIKKKPYEFFIVCLIGSLFIFTYVIRICELPLVVKLENSSFQSYLTTLWMVMITMTTVGYGDYNPKTIPGRAFGFILCIWGVFLLSMIVIILFNSLELSFEEKQALLIFNKLEAKKPLADCAARLIAETWKLRKSGDNDPKKIFEIKQEFKHLQKQLKKVDSTQYDHFFEQLNIYFENINNNIQKLSQIQITLLALKTEFDDINSALDKNYSYEQERVSEISEKDDEDDIDIPFIKKIE